MDNDKLVRYCLLLIAICAFGVVSAASVPDYENFSYKAPDVAICDKFPGKIVSSASSCTNSEMGSTTNCRVTHSMNSKFEVCDLIPPGYTNPSGTTGASFACDAPWVGATYEEKVFFGNKYWCRKPGALKCEAPLVLKDGKCVDKCADKTGVAASGWFDWGPDPKKGPSAVGCYEGCKVGYTGGGISGTALVAGKAHYFSQGEYMYYRSSCTGADTVKKPGTSKPNDTCGEGQDSASMNGTTRCYDRATGKYVDPTTGLPTDSPPTDSVKDSTTETLPDGSTKTTVRECTAKGCSTTVTVTKPDGSSNSTTTHTGGGADGSAGGGNGNGDGDEGGEDGEPTEPTKPKPFCEENPGSPICKESKYSGSCGSEPSCEGDAIQCAIARNQFQLGCSLANTDHPMHAAGQRAIDGTDEGMDALPGRGRGEEEAIKFDPGAAVDPTSGGSCPAPRVVEFEFEGSRTLSFSYEPACKTAEFIRPLILLIAGIAAVYIIFGKPA
ncbi:hypothetical protein GCM10007907_16860 [Chitinimonas prasina]|uniref:Uncharacterized protein n=1 Tax=Chitinimonas prasina TaxID=1434937 RepID=A0ABQ5YEC3_9NEIS|nr:virulence factor TspB C-terminal domain-related protein [Chitinimonas prasina]GLR12896.1 hypothetical protein GCM10007907_16860 [Chitinimonas prasina]